MKKLDVAIIGQGRSGKDIHGTYFRSERNVFYNVKYVVEFEEHRREIAESIFPGCVTLENYTELFDKDVDLVVNASYSDMHYPITKDLLKHGKNVLVEKPLGRNRFECEDLIRTAKENGVILAVFQNSTTAPYCVHAKKLMKDGVFGEVKQISISFNGFSRRWDWQTLQKKMGGSVYNTGPHPIGLALEFLDYDDNVKVEYSRLDKCLTSGDAEDYAKIILSAPNKPLVDIEINSVDPYSDYNIKIQGTKGGMKSTTRAYKYKYLDWKDYPPRPLMEESLRDKDDNPIYCNEELNFKEEEGKYPGTAFDIGTATIYENVYNVILGKGELIVSPKDISKLIGIIEKVHADNYMEREF
ncbi:MAG: Gfo/Idh/MocA family oxidoreductase [Clostridia bacterium]|nr:Gfo/Idh/MocA family oxidoreductase [Clostridia bacterium]